jgi:hypothetical protein
MTKQTDRANRAAEAARDCWGRSSYRQARVRASFVRAGRRAARFDIA